MAVEGNGTEKRPSLVREETINENIVPDYIVEPLPDAAGGEPEWLRDRLAVIRKHYFIILAVGAAAAGIAFYTVRQAVPMYRAAATVRLNDMRSNLTAGVGTTNGAQMSWSVDPIKSQIELFASRATAEEAVDRGNLQVRELTYRGSLDWLDKVDASKVKASDTLRLAFGNASVSEIFGGKSATARYGRPLTAGDLSFVVPARPAADSSKFFVTPRESVIGAVQGGLRASRRVDTDIADLTFDSPDPYFAQRALNAATLSLQALNMAASQEAAHARRQFLDQQLRKTDSILEAQRAQLSAFRSVSQAFSSKEKISAEQSSLTSIRIRREELAADRQVYTSLLARARAVQQAGQGDGMKALISAPGIAANPAIQQLYTRYVQLKSARDSLTTGPFASAKTNPDVERIDALLQSTSDQLIGSVQSQIDGLDARVAALDALGARGAAQLSLLPRTEAEEARLIQETEGT